MTHLCFREEDDRLLARGWPRQARLIHGHPDDRKAQKVARAWLTRHDRAYFSDWPREVAHQVLHAIAPNAPDVKSAVTRTVASFDAGAMSEKIIDWLFIAETVLGADETLDAIADGFEQGKRPTAVKAWVGATVGFLLLRATKPARPSSCPGWQSGKRASRRQRRRARHGASALTTSRCRLVGRRPSNA
jgi:hypothetical protein